MLLALLGSTACSPDAADPVADDDWLLERRCVAPEGLGSPRHIDDIVPLVNALPMPVTLGCVLESLDRPITVAAMTSPFSAQPTEDPAGPRLFVLTGDLVMSIVTTGEATHTLELGEYIDVARTVKAELHFPIEAPVGPEAPYEGALFGGASRCGGCHGDERPAAIVANVPSYSSTALAPEADRVVPTGFVRQHARDCSDTAPEGDDAQRCALLGAVFGHGEVVAGVFRAEDQICVAP